MWHDIEADVDLLNFGMVASAAAGLIRDAGKTPLTIGVSGGWGAGKSTLVKLVRSELETSPSTNGEGHPAYILMEFNAWLYQGYEDARQALLQAVSDRLVEEAKKRKTFLEKATDFARRIKLLNLGRIAAPVISHIAIGSVAAGPLGALFGAVSGLVQGFNDTDKREESLKAVKEAYTDLSPELKEVIGEQKESSLPKEIEGLRKAFEDLLEKLDVNLVVFVDDLDRCLPNTAIATLEAMRLLLHVKRTAFIIAADESMIRGAVRAHFKGVEIEEGLVTSYFDKLIQIPLRVPRLGTNEVKAYLVLLLTDLATRKGRLDPMIQAKGQTAVLEQLRTWNGSISRVFFDKAFAGAADVIATELDIADQLAPLLVNSSEIAGNPRLIKRFLNNLMIRRTVAEAMKMPLALEELIKIQLFERCASSAAFEFLIKAVASDPDGRAEFLVLIEAAAEKAEEYVPPHPSWSGAFYEQWIKLNPRLAAKDLRPILHLSRDRGLSLAAYDELSAEAKKLLEATMAANEVSKLLVQKLKELGEGDVSRILTRAIRRARENQWHPEDITRCLNCTDAHPQLGMQLVTALAEIPGNKRDFSILPLLKARPWADGTLQNWAEDPETNSQARQYLQKRKGAK